MKLEIKVPQMGESITEASIGEILKASGSYVKVDDEILELETDKVNQVLYAPESGTLHLTVAVDDDVTIGQVIGHVDTDGAASKDASPSSSKEESKKEEVASPTPEAKPVTGSIRKGKSEFVAGLSQKEAKPSTAPSPQPAKKATPVSSSAPRASGERETRQRMNKIRRVIAKRLVEAQQTTAMLTTFNEIDMSEVMNLRSRYKDDFVKKHGTRLGFMSFFVKAAVSALQTYPEINAYIDGDEIVYRNYYDIGIAVGTEKGLFVPIVRDCDSLPFEGVEASIRDYAVKAQGGNLALDDLRGGGFTITNGGVYGSLISTPILNPPQSGILGMHKIEKRPVVVNDEIVIRPMMYVALSYDHRIVDGKGAVSFLVHLKECLEDPSRLLLDV
jgi:2-oxoglutarate dehydrogenase E2 component (dihydrolipoamide succinyltransferase)